jgi:hypothetical protein
MVFSNFNVIKIMLCYLPLFLETDGVIYRIGKLSIFGSSEADCPHMENGLQTKLQIMLFFYNTTASAFEKNVFPNFKAAFLTLIFRWLGEI